MRYRVRASRFSQHGVYNAESTSLAIAEVVDQHYFRFWQQQAGFTDWGVGWNSEEFPKNNPSNNEYLGIWKYGMIPEPKIRTRRLKGPTWSALLPPSDGVTSVVSDEEIVDLTLTAASPQHAAHNVLSFAQEIGLDDNGTVVVVPLAGWGDVRGPDLTKELREYRKRQAENNPRLARSNR
ncbi:hypothetical protein FRB99_003805 [Tulasnella sp. 403]|nr:hypothetical protein FRB99_003805 [Tulasnella sp. 403]